MSVNAKRFDRSTFLSEFTTLCHSLDAPCSQQTTKQILAAFDEYLDEAYVWLRCTSKSAGVVNFRLAFFGTWIDTISIAAQNGWIDLDDWLPKVAASWSLRQSAKQWCDFDPSRGLAKTWIYFQHLQAVEDILRTPGLPAAVAARLPDLQTVGLDRVTYAAVDYSNRSMNVYFIVPGGLTPELAATYAALAGSNPPSEADLQIMSDLMKPAFTWGVTIELETGNIARVAFYAAVKDGASFSPLNERMRKFFAEAPWHDPQNLYIVAWSYGAGDSETYHKGKASYAGYSEELMTNMYRCWMEGSA